MQAIGAINREMKRSSRPNGHAIFHLMTGQNLPMLGLELGQSEDSSRRPTLYAT